jgi:hypothetical protein
MRFFPSTTAAVATGAIVMPLFMLGWRFIESTFSSQVPVILWFAFAFILPVLFATADLRYAAGRRQELRSFFRPLNSADDYRLFYVPAGRRMFVLFISTIVSVFALKALGVEL